MTTIIPRLKRPGDWSFDDAVEHADPLCFQPIANYRNQAIQIQEREYCFDDDSKDLEDLHS
jgi:hypothetical protein